MKMKQRIGTALLSGALLLGLLPTGALAAVEGVQDSGAAVTADGLCEHHPQHDESCGYTEGSEGTPCGHEHTEDCYALVTECVHEHGPECYPAEDVSGNTATPSDAEEQEPTACTHVCSEESGCITEVLDCKHEHDGACGYAPAIEGTPCGYVCEICTPQDSGENGGEVEDAVTENEPATPSNAMDSAVAEVQDLISALPDAEELAAMSAGEQQEAYAQVQAAYDAYQALTEEQRAQISGAEIFESLFAVFNSMTNALETAGDFEVTVNSGNTAETPYTYTPADSTNYKPGYLTVNDGADIRFLYKGIIINHC